MKIKLLSLCIFIHTFNLFSQQNIQEKILQNTTVEFETNDFYTSFYAGGSENVFKPVVTYKGNTYFIYMDALRRPIIGKIADGEAFTNRLDKNDEEPYYVQDDGHNKFSIGVDREGYIHIIGDMHHYGAQTSQVYVDRYKDYHSSQNPEGKNNIMYWVSENPEDITNFVFRGGDEERTIPGNGFTYPSLHSDMNGKLYARHRARVGNGGHFDGEMGWVLAKYDEETQQWTELGEKTPSDFEGWYDYEPLQKAIFWEDNGALSGDGEGRNWYQGFAGYMCFDFNNRLHAAATINNNSDNPFMTDILYAYSDDEGMTFNKVNDTPVNQLPIRVEEGAHQGSVLADESDSPEGFFLMPSVAGDKEGTPIVTYTKFDSSNVYGYHFGSYKYWNKDDGAWSEELDNPTGGYIRHIVALDVDGMMNYIEGSKIIREFGLTTPSSTDSDVLVDGTLMALDYRAIIEQNVLRGLVYNATEGKLKVVSIKNEVELSSISDEWETTLLGNITTDENGMFNDIFQLKSTGAFDENFSGQYVNQSIEGDFELEARIINVNYINDASFAGLMIRESDEDDTAYFGVAITSYEGVKTIYKDSEVVFDATQTEGYQPSEWLKIKRTDNLLEAYRSDNGKSWMLVDSKEIEIGNTVSGGLVAGSGNLDETSHARIDHVTIKTGNDLLSTEENDVLELSIYPNPAENTINITYSNFIGKEVLQIFDTNGRLIVNKSLEGVSTLVDVSSLQSGIYVLKIEDSKRQLTSKKLIMK